MTSPHESRGYIDYVAPPPFRPKERFEALGQADQPWLKALTGRDFNEAELAAANDLVQVGIGTGEGSGAEDRRAEIIDARRTFFGETLGWNSATSLGYSALQAMERNIDKATRLAPTNTVVDMLRLLWEQQLDYKIIKKDPSLVIRPRDGVEAKLLNLGKNGIPPKKAETYPSLLRLAETELTARANNMRSYGIDPNKGLPVLELAEELFDERYAGMKERGINDTAIEGALTSLQYPPKTLDRSIGIVSRITNTLGVDMTAIDIVNAASKILTVDPRRNLFVARLYYDLWSVDPKSMSPQDVMTEIKTAILTPADSYLASAALYGVVNRTNARRERKATPAAERREKSLGLIADRASHGNLTEMAVRAYFRYAPLKAAEVQQFPSLVDYTSH